VGFTFQTSSRILKACPQCRSQKPKEVIQGPKSVCWLAFLLLLVFTVGLGLILVPLWYNREIHAQCPNCEHVFFVSRQ